MNPIPTEAGKLPANTRRIDLPDKTVYLLGTAHISKQSVQDVAELVSAVSPDTICLELCPSRYQSMVNPESWKKMDIFQIVRENKALFVLVQLLMSSFYRKMAEKMGVRPGEEMLEGIRQAESTGAEIVLADRGIDITLRRVWGYMSLWHKMKFFFQALTGLVFSGDMQAEDIEKLKEKDQVQVLMEAMGQSFPEIKKRLIQERDIHLAQKIREAPGETVVAVVGAAHAEGISSAIHADHDLEPLLQTPPPSVIPRIAKWAIPAIIVLLILAGFFTGGATDSLHSITIWILMNGIFSALGTAVALAHPLTIGTAFFAAPLTSLNPTIAAGWVAGLVQAWVKRPTIKDLEGLSSALGSITLFWSNPAIKVLLVVVLANLGSSLGTFIAGSWIATRLL